MLDGSKQQHDLIMAHCYKEPLKRARRLFLERWQAILASYLVMDANPLYEPVFDPYGEYFDVHQKPL